jgi:hypothetical protein
VKLKERELLENEKKIANGRDENLIGRDEN